jgi:hypothetical protein
MKILEKVQEVFNQHELKAIELPEGTANVYAFLRAYPEFKKDFEPLIDEDVLQEKYLKHIPRGWYGFSIGTPTVPIWNTILDKILEVCIEADPKFEIHQIKMKFGGIRFYCHSDVIEDLYEVEFFVENKLWDMALIY